MKAAAVFVSFFVCLALLCVGFVLSRVWPTRDSNGNDPSDVAGLFIQAANRKDFDLAKTYWEEGAVEDIEARWKTPFPAFCEKKFICSSYSVTRPVKQKGDWWNLEFQGIREGKPVSQILYLKKVDGVWKLQ